MAGTDTETDTDASIGIAVCNTIDTKSCRSTSYLCDYYSLPYLTDSITYLLHLITLCNYFLLLC